MSAYARRRGTSKADKMMGVKDDNLDGNLLADGRPPIPPPPPPYPKRELCPNCKGSKTVPTKSSSSSVSVYDDCYWCAGQGWLDDLNTSDEDEVLIIRTQFTLNVSGTPIQVNRKTLLALGLSIREKNIFIDRDIDDFRDVLYWIRTKNVRRVSKEAFLEAYFWKQFDMMSELIRRRCDLTFLNLKGMDLSLVNFLNADLSHVLLDKDTKLPPKMMLNVKFDHVDLSGMNFVKFDFRGADFSKAILTGCDFTDALFDDKTKFGYGDLTGTKFVRCDLRAWSGSGENILFNTDFSYSKFQNGHQPQSGFNLPLLVTGVSFHGAEGFLVVHHTHTTIFKDCDISSYGKSLRIGYHGQTEIQVWPRIKLHGRTVMRNAQWSMGISCDLSINCDVRGTTFDNPHGYTTLTKLPLDMTGCTFNGKIILSGSSDYILEKCVFTGAKGNMADFLKSSERFAGSVFKNVTFEAPVWEHDGRPRDFSNVIFIGGFDYSRWSRVFNKSNLSGASFREASNMFSTSWKRNWTDVNLSQVDFSNCQLEGENFESSIGVPKSFEKANLKNAIFNTKTGKTDTKSLKNCSFVKANLEGVKLLNCDFSGCDLTDCLLKDADLSYSLLKNVKAMDKTNAMKVAKLSAVNFECCVCFNEDDEIVKLAPCNHSECCITCVLKLMSQKGTQNQCPICRGEVTGWNKL
jgi:uncharacterized protein YjbI with pentapeptide repeats